MGYLNHAMQIDAEDLTHIYRPEPPQAASMPKAPIIFALGLACWVLSSFAMVHILAPLAKAVASLVGQL